MKPDFQKINIKYPESASAYPDNELMEVPGLAPYTRGISPAMYVKEPMETWFAFEAMEPKEINASIKELINSGNSNFHFSERISTADWKSILEKTDLKTVQMGFSNDEVFNSFKEYLKLEKADVSALNIRNIVEINNISDLKKSHENSVIRLKPASYFQFISNMRSARKAWSQIMQNNSSALSLDVLINDSETTIEEATMLALAAWMGGAQSLTIQLSSNWENEPFINIARIIEEETHIKNSIDALGGSFYLEKFITG